MGTARASLIGSVLLAALGATTPASAMSAPELRGDLSRPVPMPLVQPVGPPPVPLLRVRPEIPGPVPMPLVGEDPLGTLVVPPAAVPTQLR